ncbi:plasmid mobilization protein [Pedobacter nutrimenti]|uniref:plasmid mobilization protein n=1 Tax=Pedobacter nutrimenti TaxID=1241337 RepID=UPI002930135C|nr:plasmid mobilization relaxosome protein MobC [Pedobacter nutrimenti]
MKEKNNRTKRVHLRLTEAEFLQLDKYFKSTTERRISNYIRSVLLQKPLYKGVVNESLKDIMATLFELRKDFNGIANNLNQVVHKLHTLDRYPDIKAWTLLFEMDRKALQKSMEEMRLYINKTAEKWLQS